MLLGVLPWARETHQKAFAERRVEDDERWDRKAVEYLWCTPKSVVLGKRRRRDPNCNSAPFTLSPFKHGPQL